jgi:hypothetical protein
MDDKEKQKLGKAINERKRKRMREGIESELMKYNRAKQIGDGINHKKMKELEKECE